MVGTRTRLVQQIDIVRVARRRIDFVAAAPVNQCNIHVVLSNSLGADILGLVFVLTIRSRR
jgi:hypothetical protein